LMDLLEIETTGADGWVGRRGGLTWIVQKMEIWVTKLSGIFLALQIIR
jgi:hypothetical protein